MATVIIGFQILTSPDTSPKGNPEVILCCRLEESDLLLTPLWPSSPGGGSRRMVDDGTG